MKWNICGVLLVVGAVTAGRDVRATREEVDMDDYGLDSTLITYHHSSVVDLEEVVLGKASWYCYVFDTPEEETIAKSEVAIFAGGANKEGKIIRLSSLNMLTGPDRNWDPELKYRYCAIETANTIVPTPSANVNQLPLTPNNKKIKYMTFNSMKFYGIKVKHPRYAEMGFRHLKIFLLRLGGYGPYSKVDFYHPTMISAPPDNIVLVLYPEIGSWS